MNSAKKKKSPPKMSPLFCSDVRLLPPNPYLELSTKPAMVSVRGPKALLSALHLGHLHTSGQRQGRARGAQSIPPHPRQHAGEAEA